MKKTLGTYLIEALEAQGVKHVFGIPGVHNLELYRGLAASTIRHVAGRHEQGLGFMADGYARVSGEVGVCFTITGPGVTNILTAMGQSYGDSVPVLVISSENRRGEIGTGRGFLHEVHDQIGMARHVAGIVERIIDPAELLPALERVFRAPRTGRPLPAYLEIPRDVLTLDASHLPVPTRFAEAPVPVPPVGLIADAARRLAAAGNPVILAGGGAARAPDQVRALAERLGAPVVMTINGRGLLAPDHPLAVPFSPSLGPVRALLAGADAVLAIGTEFGQTDYDMYAVSDFPQPRGLIRIDVDPDQLQRNLRPELGLLGDARATLTALLASDLGPSSVGRGVKAAEAARAGAFAALPPAYQREVGFLEVIRRTLPEAIIVGDSTQAVYAGNLGYAAPRPGAWFNSSSGYGTLGYALPASTGAGLAAPERPVVCLVGDGGLQFTLGELAVPRDVGAWTAVLVWNNRGYGEIKTSMLAVDIEPEGVDVRPPDLEPLSRAYGYAHRLVDSLASLEAALREFGARRQVVVLEVRAEAFE
jgi:acetolactate synthase-1/2/3 large subunit